MQKYILIVGACGQIGTELTYALRDTYGNENVIASDIREGSDDLMGSGPFEILDATDSNALEEVIAYYEINEVYLMAAMLSATAEKFPMRAWILNMNSLFNVLNLAKEKKIDKNFLAIEYRRIRTEHPQIGYAPKYHHGTQHRIWYQ